jgi:hypothetical protein
MKAVSHLLTSCWITTLIVACPAASTLAAESNTTPWQRARFIVAPERFLRHTPERAFIGPGTFVLENGDILMAAPWGRPPTNFEQLAAKFPVPMLYRSQDGGRTWKEQGRMNMEWPLTGMVSDGGVSFLRLKDGRLAALLHRHVKGLLGGGLPAISFSKDDGATWTPARLVGEPEGFWYVMNDRLIQLRQGRLLVPVAYRPKKPGTFEGDTCLGLCFFSDDGGETWKQSRTPAQLEDARGMAEPCVAEVGDRVLMLARTGSGYHFASWSDDGGDTWSKPEATTLMSACSSLTLKTLPDGRLIVFYNHAAPIKAGAFFPRTPLCYAVSDDGGKTWGPPVIVDDEGVTDKDRQNIYPSVCFTNEGMLVIWSTHGADPKGSFAGQYDANIGGAKRAILAMPTKTAPKTAARPSPQPMELTASAKPADVDGKSYDLVVVGATPGGIACAVRGAREGLSVLLVQHNKHIGGMLTNGLMQWDALYGGPRSPVFNEYAKMIEDYYRETFGEESPQFSQARYTQSHYPMSRFEPSVAEHLFNRLVSKEKNITTLLMYYPAAVKRKGAILQSLSLREYGTTHDITVTGATYVDATYEGDLAATAKVPYRVGREGRNEFGEPHAGKVFTNIESKKGPQDVLEGKLNLHTYGHVQGSIDPTSPFTADAAIQAYNHRFCLSNQAGNIRLPEKPPGYDREQYLNYNRKSMGAGALNGKSSFNSAILPGENHAYPEASWPEREKIIARHMNFALGLIWFLQNDESVPAAKREGYRRIGLPLEEFPDNHNLPYEIYVREARRIVGRSIFTEHDNRLAEGLERAPIHADSVAFTDWAMDSHDCTMDRRPGFAYDGKLILTVETRPAQIPYRCLLPQEVDNLIVPVCLSATHVAWGAVRLEPVWMQTGEAAGIAAALAKMLHTTPAKLDSELLIRKLADSRMMITFFNDVDVSSDHPGVPAAQYFGTKGFFADYDAKLDEPLTEAVRSVWLAGFQQLQQGTLEAMKQAKAVHAAESKDSPDTGERRGDALLRLWKQLINKP